MELTSAVQPQSLHESVLDLIGARIVSGELAEGRILSAEELSEEYSVSRSVIRETIRVLESLGMLTARRRAGTTVMPSSNWNLLDPLVIKWQLAGPDRLTLLHQLSELRLGIEPIAARLAAAHATPEQCAIMTEAIMGMAATERAANERDYLDYDSTFHRTLLESTGNPILGHLSATVTEVLAGRTRHRLMPSHANPDALRLHERVAVSIRLGNAEDAEAAMFDIVYEADQAIQAISET